MKVKIVLPWLLFFMGLSQGIFVSSLYAYLDPGTGSYLLQLAVAALLGASFAIKLFWHRITTFFSELFKKHKKDDQSD